MLDEIKDIRASIWISASAGTGKTKSLIDRILALLLNGVLPSKILCLTYTKAAASEMLTRLSKDLQNFSEMTDLELKQKLNSMGFDESYFVIAKSLYEKSMNSSEWVQIKTIHSFCLNILEKFPLESGIFPGVKICDSYQTKYLLNEAVRFVLSNKKNHCFLEQISNYTTDLISTIEQHLVKFSSFFSNFDDFKQLYSVFFCINSESSFTNDVELNNYLFNKVFCGEHQKLFLELSEILFKGSSEDIKKAEILSENSKNPTSDFIYAFLTDKHTIRSNLCTKKISDIYKDFSSNMQDIAQKALEFYELRKNHIAVISNVAFFSILKEILFNYNELKRKNHLIDFYDIISITSSLLNNIEWVMYKIDGGVDHLLIDEAQDTSPEQWDIIKAITDEFFTNYNSDKTVFVVGDEKQSIYSFQGADFQLFQDMHKYFKARSETNGQRFHDVILNKSYRTTGNILSFVDDVFQNSFSNIKHVTNRPLNSGIVEIIDLFESDKYDELDSWEIAENSGKHDTASKKKAKYIANFIKEMLAKCTFVESKNRHAIASDFLILFQRRDMNVMKNIISALKELDIDVTGIDRVLLKDELIVEDLIVFAEFAIFPIDDLACARVLKSPIVGMTEEDLMNACIDRQEKHLWNYLLENNELYTKYSLEKLEKYIERSTTISVYDFFVNALNDGVKEKFICRLGVECLDILYEFLDIVMLYVHENTASVSGFLAWFHAFEHEIKRESFANIDSVRIMTVHSSKGLQSPFVILADTHFFKLFNETILKSKNGILVWDFSSEMRPQIVENICEEYKSFFEKESKRLLYVALTRAEDFLYIFGAQPQKKMSENCWYNFIKNNLKTNKFEKLQRDNHDILRFGNYQYIESELPEKEKNLNITEADSFEIPDWFFEKLEFPFVEDVEIYSQTEQMIYGECVHLLLSEMPKYRQYFDTSFDVFAENLLNKFDVSDGIKNKAKSEAYRILVNPKFDFIFDNNSLSEVSFVNSGKEGRIDKIIFAKDYILIIDFKTGVSQEDISMAYINQLAYYKNAVRQMFNIESAVDIKTAILWTQSAKLVEINI